MLELDAVRTVAFRVFVACLAITGIAIEVTELVSYYPPSGWAWTWREDAPLVVRRVLHGIRSLGSGVIALVLVWRIGTRWYALLGAAWLAFWSLEAALVLTRPALNATAAVFVFRMIYGGFNHLLAIGFFQTFPRVLAASDVRADPAAPAWKRGWRALLAVLLRPFVLTLLALTGCFLWLIRIEALVHVFTAFVSGVAISYLLISLRQSSEEERRRLFWIFEAVLLVLISNIFTAMTVLAALVFDAPALSSPALRIVGNAGYVLALACIALAIFYSGALDVGLVVRRTAILTAAATTVVLLFLALQALVVNTVAARLGMERGWGSVLAGALSAFAFRPVDRYVDRRIEGWLARKVVR